MKRNLSDDERGLSESLGVTILFSIIVVAASIAYLYGLPVLQEQQASAQASSAVDGLQLLDSNIEDHSQLGVEQRNTMLGTDGGKVSLSGSTTITITVSGQTYSRTTTPLKYQVNERVLVYEAGATFRQSSQGNAAMVADPPIRITQNNVLLQFIQLKGQDSVRSSRQVTIRTQLIGRQAQEFEGSALDPVIIIESNRAPAWKQYLQDHPGTSCSLVSQTEVECTISNVDNVGIQFVEIDARIDQ